MTSSTEKQVDDLLNKFGEVAQDFVGRQKELFTEAGVAAAEKSALTSLNEIAMAAKELTAEQVGETPAAAYIYARGIADAMAEQAYQAPLFKAHHLRKQANAASRNIFKGINKMIKTIGQEKIEAAQATSAKTANYIRFAPGSGNNKITIA